MMHLEDRAQTLCTEYRAQRFVFQGLDPPDSDPM